MIRDTRLALVAGLLAIAMNTTSQAAEHAHPKAVILAPGYADLEFVPPVPGSYQLPPFASASDASLLDSSGRRVSLHKLFQDKLILLSFIYTRCSDVNGCPLATHVLARLHEKLQAHDDLDGKLRLVSISFDPDYDTPEVMSRYSSMFAAENADWHFLTAPSEAELTPMLEAYNQWVVRDYDEQGNYLGSISHLLRVYLIDQQQRVRNIYSVSFLHADTIANDIRTLLHEVSELPD